MMDYASRSSDHALSAACAPNNSRAERAMSTDAAAWHGGGGTGGLFKGLWFTLRAVVSTEDEQKATAIIRQARQRQTPVHE